MDKTKSKEIFGVIAALPLVLIHGYSDDSSIWDSWLTWLTDDNITNVYPITFSNDDECGSVADHASELDNIVDKILNDTDSEKVNIVAHSKGGLDARWYISNSDKVANLVMIGTPNEGTAAAYMDVTTCAFEGSAGLEDMQPESIATQSVNQNGTNYYTVAGNYAAPCYIVIMRYTCYVIPNDGFVTVDSAKSHYVSLGVLHYNHSSLLIHKDIYEKVLPIIGGVQ